LDSQHPTITIVGFCKASYNTATSHTGCTLLLLLLSLTISLSVYVPIFLKQFSKEHVHVIASAWIACRLFAEVIRETSRFYSKKKNLGVSGTFSVWNVHVCKHAIFVISGTCLGYLYNIYFTLDLYIAEFISLKHSIILSPKEWIFIVKSEYARTTFHWVRSSTSSYCRNTSFERGIYWSLLIVLHVRYIFRTYNKKYWSI